MSFLLKKSDRVVLLVGLFLGCIALSQPYLKAFFGSGSSGPRLSGVNGKTVRVKEVEVRIPRLVEGKDKFDLNTADREQLVQLSGIGSVLAERIISYRKENGNFSSLSELKEVSGIGAHTLNRIKEGLTVGKGSS